MGFGVAFIFMLIGMDQLIFGGAVTKRPNLDLTSAFWTNWGTWGRYEYCKSGTFVSGFQEKVEPVQNTWDDTALDGLAVFCTKLGSRNAAHDELTSKVGESNGVWKRKFHCPQHSYGLGFALRAEFPQGYWDDTAGNNFRLLCSDRTNVTGDGLDFGHWQKESVCPRNHGLCGLQTQVEAYMGFGYILGRDDTGLNNIRMKCCPILPEKLLKCEATASWELIKEDMNRNDGRIKIFKTRYFKTQVGTFLNTSSIPKEQLDIYKTLNQSRFQIQDYSALLTPGFKKVDAGPLSNDSEANNLTLTVGPSTWDPIRDSYVEYAIKERTHMQLYQLVLECPPFQTRSDVFHRIFTPLHGETDCPTSNQTCIDTFWTFWKSHS